WAGANFATTDNFDFTGGGAGSRVVITGDPVGGADRDPHPDREGRWLDPAAFARPSGRFDLGNAPSAFFRLPWIRTSNVAFFKNFPAGGRRRLQVRWEIYNVFNQVNWANIDTFLVFDPAGRQ